MPDQVKYISRLQGKRVLVIGGSSGVGYAVAEAAVEHGARVFISSSKPQRVEGAVKALRAAYPSAAAENCITGFAFDLSDEHHIEDRMLELLESSGGNLDHVVYTAGDTIPPIPIADTTLEVIQSAATVRYTSPLFLAKHATKYLRSSFESSITLTTGVVTEKPIPNFSVIAGSRSAVIGLGKNLALDLRPIRVNVVSLGAVETDTWLGLPPGKREEVFRAIGERSTTGRIAEASDVAEAYLYCMKDRNVTGSVISSNGGSLLM